MARALRALGRWAVIEPILVVVGFTLLAIIVTWPVAAHMGTVIPSPGIAWDPAGYIWDFWQRAHDGMPLWGDSTTSMISVPFGRTYPAAADATQLVSYGPAWLITHVAGPVVAYNVVIISGLALSGMAMYGLIRWLGTGPGISAWAGGAYALFPYALGKAIVHAPLVHLACFPLAVLAGLWWSERPSWRRALVVAGAYGFAWLTNPYYGLMATVVLAVVCGAGLVRMLRAGGLATAARGGGLLMGLNAVLVLLPVALLGRSASSDATAGIARQAIDLDNFGARITDFLTPPTNSVFMNGAIDPTWTGVTAVGDERLILYVGLTTIAVALLGAIACWRASGPSASRIQMAARAAAVLVPVLAWFSLASPTRWLGVDIPVPSLWIWESVPNYRVFARFVAPLMCALLVLGALGLRWLASRGGTVWRLSIIATAMIVTFADLDTGIPVATATPVTANGRGPGDSPTWAWLRAQRAPGSVVEYPTDPENYGPAFDSVERIWAFGQTIHERPIVNGGLIPGQRGYEFAAQVSDANRPGTATDLATAGVRFAVINPWAFGALGRTPNLDVNTPPAGFSVERVFPDGTAIWRVTAPPQTGIVLFQRPGFAWGTREGRATWHRLTARKAVLTIWAPRTGDYRVTLPLRALSAEALKTTGGLEGQITLTPQGDSLILALEAGPTPREVELAIRGPLPRGAAIGSATMKAAR